MTYKGDSPGKKVTRAYSWLRTLSLFRSVGFPEKKAIILAGDGGDMPLLDFGGINSNDIHAVDSNISKLKTFYNEFPFINVSNQEVGSYCKSISNTYNMVHLDFCGRLSVANILTFTDVIENIAKPSFIILTVLKGREANGKKGSKKDLWIGLSRNIRRQTIRYLNKQCKLSKEKRIWTWWKIMYDFAVHMLSNKDGDVFKPRYLLSLLKNRYKKYKDAPFVEIEKDKWLNENILDSNFKIKSSGQGLMRIEAFKKCGQIIGGARDLYRESRGHKRLCDFEANVISCISYHSKTKTDHGTPFVSGTIFCGSENESKILVKEISKTPCANFIHLDAKDSINQMKAISVQSTADSKSIGDLFDVPKATIAAWRAHYKMGTYGSLPSPLLLVGYKGVDISNYSYRVIF